MSFLRKGEWGSGGVGEENLLRSRILFPPFPHSPILPFLIVVLAMALLVPVSVRAQDAGAFARLGFGARGMALGNALAADVSGRASPYYNPALAPYVPRQHLSASTALMSFDRRLQFLQFAAPIRPRAGVAAGLIHAGVSDIQGRDDSGNPTETFSTESYAFFLAFGTRIGERLSVGAAFTLHQTQLVDAVDPVRGLGVDLGLTAKVTERLHLGLVVGDLLARYEWDTSSLYGRDGRIKTDRFPVRLRLGASYQLVPGRAWLLGEYEVQRTRREESGGEAVTVTQGRGRVGGAYAPLDGFMLHAGTDRLGAEAWGGMRRAAGFALDESIGQLPLRAAYTFVYEANTGSGMHLVALTLFL